MSRRLTRIALAFVVFLVLAQFIRPSDAGLPIDANRTIQAQPGMNELGAVLGRSCGDCHSNLAVSRWYTRIAPMSWLMAYGVAKGRKVVNFSEWASYSPEQQRILLALSCEDVSDGKMPGVYTRLCPETAPSAQDVAMICAAARQTEASAAGVSR